MYAFTVLDVVWLTSATFRVVLVVRDNKGMVVAAGSQDMLHYLWLHDFVQRNGNDKVLGKVGR